MSLRPWTIGEQTLTIIPPRPEGMPDDHPWNGLQITFSHDPDDTSRKRLRVAPPNPDEPAAEVVVTGNGTQESLVWQPRNRKAWDRTLPAVERDPAGHWVWKGTAPVGGKPTVLTHADIEEYNALAKLYSQPVLEVGELIDEPVHEQGVPAQEDVDTNQQKDDPNQRAPAQPQPAPSTTAAKRAK